MLGIGIGIGINRGVPEDTTPAPYGQIFSSDFTTLGSLSAYTVVQPDSIIGLSGGYLNIDHNPASATFVNYLTYDSWGHTQLEKYTISSIGIPRDKNASNSGWGVGIKSTNVGGATQNVWATFRQESGANDGKCIIYMDGNGKATTTAIAWSIGDRISISLTRNKFEYTVTVQNLTTGSSAQTATWYADFSGSNDTQRIGKPGIVSLGGEVDIESLTYTSNVYKYGTFATISDSIGHGNSSILANNYTVRYTEAALAGLSSNLYHVYAASNNTTQDILNNLPEIIAHKPRYVLLHIGRNDVELAVAQATREANYTSIRNQLAAAGITVIHLYAIPSDTIDLTGWNTFVSGFTADTRIDIYTPLNDSGTGIYEKYDSDNTHPNILGHAKVAETIYNSIKSLFTYSYHEDTSSYLTRTSGSFTDAEKFHYDYLIRHANGTSQWDYIELLQIYAQNNATDAVRNLVSATPSGTLTNAPTFSANNGYTFNGTTQWLDTGFNLSTATLYTQNSGYLGVYVRTTGSSGEGCDLGAFDATPGNRSHIFSRYTAGTKQTIGVNSATGTDDNTKGAGFYQVKRTAAAVEAWRFDSNSSTYSSSGTASSVTRPNCTLGVGARNRATGGVVNYSDRQIALVICGSGSIDLTIMNYLVRVYMDFKGAGV